MVGLPGTITLEGSVLSLKTEFHITLIDVKSIASLIDENNVAKTEDEIVEEFKDFIKQLPLEEHTILHSFRFVSRDTRKTIIAMAEVPHLSEFFDRLRQKYGKNLPSQPTHVTIYTLPPGGGIGILSQEELTRDSKLVGLNLNWQT